MTLEMTTFSLEFSRELEAKKELIKRTFCKGTTDDEAELFFHACKKLRLDPFMKQIYAVKRKDYKSGKETMTIQTGIDGFRLIAERTGKYSPGREPTYKYDDNGKLISATSYVKKLTNDGIWHEVAATAFFSEYEPPFKSNFWERMPHVMLAKCAETLALKKAFPAEFSGINSDEEMMQAQNAVQVQHIEDEALNDTQYAKINDYLADDEDAEEIILKGLNLAGIHLMKQKDFERTVAYLEKRKEKKNGSNVA